MVSALLPIALLLAQAGGYSAQGPLRMAPTDDAPEQISYTETGPHGLGRTHWHLWASGRGEYQSSEDGADPVRIPLSAGPDGFRRLREMLQPLETRRALRCDSDVSDQAIGVLTWARGAQHVSLHLDFGCTPAAGEDGLAKVRAAERMVLDWAARPVRNCGDAAACGPAPRRD